MGIRKQTRYLATASAALALTTFAVSASASPSAPEGGRLLATGGVTQIEGAGGGGIVPWATITGYGTNDQWGGTGFFTYANTGGFTLTDYGLAVGLWNRIEVSVARMGLNGGRLDTILGALSKDPVNGDQGYALSMDVESLKVRLLGDAVYAQNSWLPQIAFGVQFKQNTSSGVGFLGSKDVPEAIGAKSNNGTDFYLAFTKLYIGGFFGRDLLLNATVRATKANQIGLLGFGGPASNSYHAEGEFSAEVLLRPDFAFGGEFRMKPDNLNVAGTPTNLKEDNWADVNFVYFPSKAFSLTLAYAMLGNIAGAANQNGLFLSAQIAY